MSFFDLNEIYFMTAASCFLQYFSFIHDLEYTLSSYQYVGGDLMIFWHKEKI